MCASSRLCFALLLLTAACARNPAPEDFLPDARGAQQSGRGAWAILTSAGGDSFAGELLAVSSDSIWLLQDGVHALARGSLSKVQFAVFDAKNGLLQAWVFFGTLSTVSNGWFLGLTAPLWMAGGAGTAAVASKQPLYKWETGEPLEPFARFARFPAGIPPSVDRSAIR